MNAGRPAFTEVDAALYALKGKADHVLVDVHAEATSEKVGMGWHLDGRVTAVVGPIRMCRPRTRACCRAGPPTSPTSA